VEEAAQEPNLADESAPFGREKQVRLHRALREVDQDLADYYLGALQVLSDQSNADRFALAAHGLREIMRQAPKVIDVPVEKEEQGEYNLGDKVREILERWKEMVKHTTCTEEGQDWGGEIDDRLKYYLSRLESFFDTFSTQRPKTRDTVHSLLNALEYTDTPVAKRTADATFDDWNDFREFFNGIAHHGAFPGEDVFEEQLRDFEDFLHGLLRPPTSEEITEIDRIIDEAEGQND
jgi:hypothetical protein